MNQIRYTRSALQDLDDIFDRIVDDNPDAAERVIRRIENVAARLAMFPRMGRDCSSLADGLRHFSSHPYPYVLYYRPIDNGTRLIRVLHSARDATRIFNGPDE